MNDLISFPKTADFSGLRLEQTINGHVVTPWMSFDWKTEIEMTSPSHYRSVYHRIIASAKEAFAGLLGISEDDMIVSETFDPEHGEYRWRLGTKRPCALPAKKITRPENQGAIDV